ncbi:MAG: hypothetical protein COV36_05445 [Alphaproteobacteria bacterium CG11_big_fil_rev_8_21_14_0_20_44_7]|nr:MAG: hypothetical protein COV36_05445 [Alphaproteobacteria bacterium CG11_big_fil_rev_8_21_14_0_20_44_7]
MTDTEQKTALQQLAALLSDDYTSFTVEDTDTGKSLVHRTTMNCSAEELDNHIDSTLHPMYHRGLAEGAVSLSRVINMDNKVYRPDVPTYKLTISIDTSHESFPDFMDNMFNKVVTQVQSLLEQIPESYRTKLAQTQGAEVATDNTPPRA